MSSDVPTNLQFNSEFFTSMINQINGLTSSLTYNYTNADGSITTLIGNPYVVNVSNDPITYIPVEDGVYIAVIVNICNYLFNLNLTNVNNTGGGSYGTLSQTYNSTDNTNQVSLTLINIPYEYQPSNNISVVVYITFDYVTEGVTLSPTTTTNTSFSQATANGTVNFTISYDPTTSSEAPYGSNIYSNVSISYLCMVQSSNYMDNVIYNSTGGAQYINSSRTQAIENAFNPIYESFVNAYLQSVTFTFPLTQPVVS